MYHVLVVEDSKIAREAVERSLDRSAEYTLTASIENAANAEIICMRNRVDLILMDICTADDESGLDAAAKIKKYYPGIRIIMMTSMPEVSFLRKAREAGCDSFWYKEYGNEDLLSVCNRTMNGEQVWPTEEPVVKIGLTDSTEFTGRELDVIRLLAQGCSYDEIAEQLCISTNTVKYHIKNLLQKTGYRTTMQLVTEVVDKRMILPKY